MGSKSSQYLLVIIFVILLTPVNFGKSEISAIDVDIILDGSASFGEKINVEFNRTTLDDNEVLSLGEDIYIDLSFDLASYLINPNCGDPVTEWYNDEPDEYGSYSTTRFCGDLNLYLDNMDLGIYYLENSILAGGAPMLLSMELLPGWHYLTVIAAEYVSDISHTTFHWEWAFDQIAFYLQPEGEKNVSELEEINNICAFKAVPKKHNELYNYFEWTFIEIQPHTEIPTGISKNQELYRRKDEAYVEVHYNFTTSDLKLSDTSGLVIFQNETSMGHGTSCWFNDQMEIIYNSEGVYNLHEGLNYVGFAAVGFEAYSQNLDNFKPKPAVDFSSRLFTIDTSNVRASYTFGYPIIGLVIINILVKIVQRSRRKKIE